MIQELVDYCKAQFEQDGELPLCGCLQGMSCTDCLKEIHFCRESTRKYDCKRMCYWYVCQDIYRYSTEMLWLFHERELGLKRRKSPLRICSIGCGPCSELVAFEEYYRNKDLPFEFTYTGFDTNTIWNPIQGYITSLSSYPEKISFCHEDVFDYYSKVDERPNIIILNYMLSDMLKYGKGPFIAFLKRLGEFIEMIPSCALLINDINLGLSDTQPRFYYSSIANMIRNKNKGHRVSVICSHFKNSKRNYYAYGNERVRSDVLFKVPDEISTKFDTNTECHSAQLLIIKDKESEK